MSATDSKAVESTSQICMKCGGIRDAYIRRTQGDWNMRQGMCPDCFEEHLNKMIETVLGHLPADNHEWVVSEILHHCPNGEEKSIKDHLDLLATDLSEDLVGRDNPCTECGQTLGYMSGLCPDCWQDRQDARNGVLEESDEEPEELQANEGQAEVQEAQIEDDGSWINSWQDPRYDPEAPEGVQE